MKGKVRILPLMVLLILAMGIMLVPAQAQDLMSVSAPSCDYGGELSSITALDTQTVQFTLCYADPAFPSKVAFSALQIQPSEYLESTGGGGE